MYDATVGRWLSEDPIGFAGQDTNLWRYAANAPTTQVDPTGLLDAYAAQLLGSAMHSYFDGDYTDAISLLEQAIAVDGRHPLIYYFRGLARRAVGHDGAAIDFDHGAALEHEGVTGPPPIGQSLQRIQGAIRTELESYRRQGAAARSRWDVMLILQNSPDFVYLRNVRPEIAGQFFAKFYEVISKFNTTCRELLKENLKGVRVFANMAEFAAAIEEVPRLRAHYGPTPPFAFFDDPVTDEVWFNAEFALAGRRLVPHELAHAIDEGNRFSQTAQWLRAWREEFTATDPEGLDFPLTYRASQRPWEAFADYLSKFNYGTDQEKRELRDGFPQAWCFLRERRLVDPLPR